MNIAAENWLLPALVGGMMGIFYFAGLWWTVQKLATTRRSAALVILSYLGRLALTMLVFYWVLRTYSLMLLVSLICFIAIRIFLVYLWGPIRPAGGRA